MGKGSSNTSGVPQFRSGTIVPPTPKRASHRIAVTLKAGRDFVPGPEPLTTLTSTNAQGIKIAGRESLAVERAKAPEASRESDVRTLSYGERDEADVAARIYRDSKGRVERTADMPDGPLPAAVKVRKAVAGKGRKADASRARTEEGKAARAHQDTLIMGVLRGSGWDGSTPITRQMRQAALDVIAHRDQVREYAADKG